MHRRASHAILMHRRDFSTFHRECVASQRVAGPIGCVTSGGFRNLLATRYNEAITHKVCVRVLRDWSLITGRGGLQNGKIAGLKLFAPPPQDRVKLFAPPLLKSGKFTRPPYNMA